MELQRKTILVTRPLKQAAETIAEFERQGATVIHIPLIEIVDPSDHYCALDEAIKRLYEYQWLVFTSQNAVMQFFSRPAAPCAEELTLRVVAIGSTTEKLLRDLGIVNVVVADEATSPGLLDTLSSYDIKGKRVLFPRAKEGNDVVADGLRRIGAHVDVVEAYRTIFPRHFDRGYFVSLINEKKIDVVHVASPSAVRHFMIVIDEEKLKEKIASLEFLAIGPTTADEVKRLGLTPRQQV